MTLDGLLCTRCERQLTSPFSSQVFTPDGSHYEVSDGVPKDVVDGRNAVVVYLHKNCKRGTRYRATIVSSTSARRAPPEMRGPVSAAEELRGMGFRVSSRGHRFLMVLPKMMADEVSSL